MPRRIGKGFRMDENPPEAMKRPMGLTGHVNPFQNVKIISL
jgi:hypothetical protein